MSEINKVLDETHAADRLKEKASMEMGLTAVHTCLEIVSKQALTGGNFEEVNQAMGWLRSMLGAFHSRLEDLKNDKK